MDNIKKEDKNTNKSNKKRCFKCNKKLPLIPFSCKCENFFCSKCRMPENHTCTFNWKQNYKEKLEKENQKIIAIKLEKC